MRFQFQSCEDYPTGRTRADEDYSLGDRLNNCAITGSHNFRTRSIGWECGHRLNEDGLTIATDTSARLVRHIGYQMIS